VWRTIFDGLVSLGGDDCFSSGHEIGFSESKAKGTSTSLEKRLLTKKCSLSYSVAASQLDAENGALIRRMAA